VGLDHPIRNELKPQRIHGTIISLSAKIVGGLNNQSKYRKWTQNSQHNSIP